MYRAKCGGGGLWSSVPFILLDLPFGLVVPKSLGSFSQATALLFDALAQTAKGSRVPRGRHHLWQRDAAAPEGPLWHLPSQGKAFSFITCAGGSTKARDSVQEKAKSSEGPCVLLNCG